MQADGATDNVGAIHSAERYMNIQGLRLNYSTLSHLNNLRHHPKAVVSKKAWAARGEKVLIEHVSPQRDLIRKICDLVCDEELVQFVRKHYLLVLLTPEEALHLNKQ